MHTNTTRATQNATLPRRNRQNPALYQHILSDLAVEADQLKTPVSPTTPTKIRDKNNTKCPIAQNKRTLRAPGSAPLSLLPSGPGEVQMIPSHGGSLPSLHMPPHKGDSGKQKSRHPKDGGATAEDGGFEPPRACTQHAFQACAIGH